VDGGDIEASWRANDPSWDWSRPCPLTRDEIECFPVYPRAITFTIGQTYGVLARHRDPAGEWHLLEVRLGNGYASTLRARVTIVDALAGGN
jgi:hypothetical protein